MRTLAVVLSVVCLTGAVHAADLLFLDSEPGDYIGQGIPERLTPADGAFSASRNFDNGVSISIFGSLRFWSLDFAAASNAELAPGSYEGATRFPFQGSGEPGLSVSGDGRGCNTLTGRFTVLEVTYGPGGEVLSFSADFEQHCEGGTAALFGAIRFHAGDPTCEAAIDGTTCDDGDACSATSSCLTGACTGAGATPCTAAEQCHAEACDPTSGTCVVRTLPDYAPCDDGDPCTFTETCQGGVCVGCVDDGDICTEEYCDSQFGCTSRPVADCCHTDADCDDGNLCTEDACGADHRCTSDPVPCWDIMGKVTATASANGRTASETRRFRGVLILKEDGTYRVPAGICATTGEPLPDEVGVTQPGRRGRLLLKGTNLDEVYAALDECVGRHVRVVAYRFWVKILPDLQHLRGASSLRARTRVNGVSVAIQATQRFRGTKVAGGQVAGGTQAASPAYSLTAIPFSAP